MRARLLLLLEDHEEVRLCGDLDSRWVELVVGTAFHPSSAVGEGIVRTFIQEGGRVAFCGRPCDPGEALAKELNVLAPAAAMHAVVDARNTSELEGFFDTTLARFGRLDCLVNNVGTHPPATPSASRPAHDSASDVRGHVWCCPQSKVSRSPSSGSCSS